MTSVRRNGARERAPRAEQVLVHRDRRVDVAPCGCGAGRITLDPRLSDTLGLQDRRVRIRRLGVARTDVLLVRPRMVDVERQQDEGLVADLDRIANAHRLLTHRKVRAQLTFARHPLVDEGLPCRGLRGVVHSTVSSPVSRPRRRVTPRTARATPGA